MNQIKASGKSILELGRQGENLARQVVFDLSAWEAEYGPGTVELIHQRPGDEKPYPVAVRREDTFVLWDLTSADTAVAGSYGHCELRWYVGDILAKSKIWRTWVEPAMDTPSETAPPEPEQGWVDQIIAVGAAAKASADAAKADADRAAALAAQAAEKAAQTAQNASDAAKAMEAAQTAQRLAEEAQGAAEAARTAAAAAQAAAETAATDAAGAKQGAETALKSAQDAAAAAAKALADIRTLYQEMQTWAQGVIQTVNSAADSAGQSATNAAGSASAASKAQSAAETAQRGAEDAKTKAEASKEASAKSETAAKLSEQNAKTSEDAAKESEDNAAGSASAAADSATAAQAAQSGAEAAQSAAEQSAQEAAGSAAVYDSVVADVTRLKQDLGNLSHDEIGKNKFNPDELVIGFLKADGTISESESYRTTGYIAVTAGDVVTASFCDTSTKVQNVATMRFLMAYDSDKAPISLISENVQTYTVPDGVAYIRASIHVSTYLTETRTVQIEFTSDGMFTSYEPYRSWTALNDDVVIQEIVNARESSDGKKYATLKERLDAQEDGRVTESVNARNLLNMNDPDFLPGKFIAPITGVIHDGNYNTSGYIPVNPGDCLQMSYKNGAAGMRFIAAYNADMVIQKDKGYSNVTETWVVPDGVAFVRVSWSYPSYGTDVQIEVSNHGATTYQEYHDPIEMIPQSKIKSPELHCYMPREIYCAVGRTIELYNNQVCLEADRYHVQWICSVGTAYKRKFSVSPNAAQIGSKRLRMVIYDDDLNEIWSGTTTLRIVADSKPQKNILAIGDSLTNWKRWLPEVRKLSDDHITFVGTRESGVDYSADGTAYEQGSIHHEGRSGFSAASYLSDTSYTFDTRYSGSSSVDGSANPFWDGTGFSYSHYLSTQGDSIGGTPDAVQIYLGTNGMDIDPKENGDAIIEMVRRIRADNAEIPIFVVNTIYRSRQDGYASVGADGYTTGSASAFQRNEDAKVMALANYLRDRLSQIAGVTVIPLCLMHDTDYNFGSKTVKANPRAVQDVLVPEESVHPQGQGYYQMADVFYSAYCGVLN